MNLSAAVSSLTAGAMCLALASHNGFKALYVLAAGLSALAGAINLFDCFKAWHSDDESEKRGFD